MANKVGKLIKEARTGADLTQAKLAKKVGGGITASDIGRAERGELELSQAVLKKIAKATGVTQASLLNAAKASGKSTTAAATTAAKKPKTPSNAGISLRVTSTEKKLIEYYRLADSDTKKAATKVLKGESPDLISTLIGTLTGSSASAASSSSGGSVADTIGDVLGSLLDGK